MSKRFPFSRLPSELRQKIFLHALYCTYDSADLKGALSDSKRLSGTDTEAELRLGQHTLNALRLTSWNFHHDVIVASETWMSYVTIDLLENFEDVEAERLVVAKGLEDAWQMEHPYQILHVDPLENIMYDLINELRAITVDVSAARQYHWRMRLSGKSDRLKALYDNSIEWLRCRERQCLMEESRGKPLKRQMIICFRQPDAKRQDLLISHEAEGEWDAYGWLPFPEAEIQESQWWRPYARPRELKTRFLA